LGNIIGHGRPEAKSGWRGSGSGAQRVHFALVLPLDLHFNDDVGDFSIAVSAGAAP
jgi:hypothetical protein